MNVEDNIVGEGSDGSDFEGHDLSFDDSEDERVLGLDDGFDEQAKIHGKRGQ